MKGPTKEHTDDGYFKQDYQRKCNAERKEDTVNIEEKASVKYSISDDAKDIDKL